EGPDHHEEAVDHQVAQHVCHEVALGLEAGDGFLTAWIVGHGGSIPRRPGALAARSRASAATKCNHSGMEPIDRAQLDAAVAICRRMGDSTKQLFGSANLEIFGKNDGTPVTEADYAAERLARKEISKTFPDDSIIGEEGAPKDGTSGRTWVL